MSPSVTELYCVNGQVNTSCNDKFEYAVELTGRLMLLKEEKKNVLQKINKLFLKQAVFDQI